MNARRILRSVALPATIVATMVAGALYGGQAGPLPTAPETGKAKTERVTVDGKVYTKHYQDPVRLKASDFELAHDGVTKHGQGIATSPPIAYDPPDNSYPMQDYWFEGLPYILHRKATSGNPPVTLNYYRAGFEAYSWRGDYDTIFGDAETVALNQWDIWVALVSHPVGGTLTTNKIGPYKSASANPGNYVCQSVTGEVMIPWSANTILRTNLVLRPTWKWWDSQSASFRVNPYGQTRRMTHSFGLLADGEDSTIIAAYTNSWSDYVGIPGNSGTGTPCAAEPIQEP